MKRYCTARIVDGLEFGDTYITAKSEKAAREVARIMREHFNMDQIFVLGKLIKAYEINNYN